MRPTPPWPPTKGAIAEPHKVLEGSSWDWAGRGLCSFYRLPNEAELLALVEQGRHIAALKLLHEKPG